MLKIIVAGPKGCGKTTMSNFISGHSADLGGERYDPTVGVRILEFEAPGRSSHENVSIELWDASGDHNYETCWRGIMADSDAVILVFNPDTPGQDQQIGDWFEFFVKKNGLRDDQCMIFAHRGNGNSNDRFRPRTFYHSFRIEYFSVSSMNLIIFYYSFFLLISPLQHHYFKK